KQAFPAVAGNDVNNPGIPPNERKIPADTLKVIREGANDGVRSDAFFNVVLVLKRLNFSVDQIRSLLEQHPDGIARKYVGRLRQEIERVYGKLDQAQRNVTKIFPLTAFKDIKLDLKRRHYLVKGLIPRTGIVVIWGPPKCYKSFWATDVALHIALGWE